MATATRAYAPTYQSTLIELGESVPAVAKIMAIRNGNLYAVWTVIEGFDRTTRDKIYAAEREMFDTLPQNRFEFNVVEGDETTMIDHAEVVYVREARHPGARR